MAIEKGGRVHGPSVPFTRNFRGACTREFRRVNFALEDLDLYTATIKMAVSGEEGNFLRAPS